MPFVSVTDEPRQTKPEPEIAGGAGLTVIGKVAIQPVESKYVIVKVPEAIPVTIPEEVPIVANPVILLLHVPPVVASPSVAEVPTQILFGPVTAAGVVFTVALAVIKHPVGNV